MTLADKIAGGLWGLLIGDALGVPYEFHAPERLPPQELIDFVPPPGFARAHAGIAPGTWSDDGAHALCLLASLLHCGRLDVDDLMRRLGDWYRHGYLAVDNHVFDVGIQTRRALEAFEPGVPALECGPAGERDNGNGSLMRVLPLALWHRGSDEELARDAQLQSRVTHGHVRARVCCAFYCLWARRLLAGHGDAWRATAATLRGLFADGTAERDELEQQVRPDEVLRGTGSGYVLDSLLSARQVLAGASYGDVVRGAIALGHDTDTTASIAGGLAGVRHGASGLPTAWLAALRGRELVEPLLEALLARAAGVG